MVNMDGTQPVAIGFGPDPLHPHGPRRADAVVGANPGHLRRAILQSVPRVPGVYGMLDRSGRLLYVGKSKSLRARLLSYFSPSNADAKGGRMIRHARAIQWEIQPSEFASLLREQQLIRKFSPRWNVQEVPQRQRPVYLCLGRNPAYFFAARTPQKNCLGVAGPFYGAARMRLAVEALNKVFRLRDCPEKQVFRFADQLQLFEVEYRPGCLRLEVGTCMGPCAAACSRAAYDAQVNAAESFLDGFNDEPLVVVSDQLQRAIDDQQYELAGRAHRTLQSLAYVQRKLSTLLSARRKFTFVYAPPAFDGQSTWFLIHSGEVVDCLRAPRRPEELEPVQTQLRAWATLASNRLDRGHGPFPHTLQLVASWFKRHPRELQYTFVPDKPVLTFADKIISA